MPGSEILPADAVGLLDDLTRIIAHACAEIRTVSPVTVVQRIIHVASTAGARAPTRPQRSRETLPGHAPVLPPLRKGH